MNQANLSHLGLSHAALKAAILAELDEEEFGGGAENIAEAVADSIEANNAEILRQLRKILFSPASD